MRLLRRSTSAANGSRKASELEPPPPPLSLEATVAFDTDADEELELPALELELLLDELLAASTASYALSRPAPQVDVVQLHSDSLTGTLVVLVGTWQVLGAVAGKAVAVACRVLRISFGVNELLAPSISAMVPDTIGAEKLVPRL